MNSVNTKSTTENAFNLQFIVSSNARSILTFKMWKTHKLGLLLNKTMYMNENKFTENYPKHEYSIISKMLLCTNAAPKSDSNC